MRILIAEDDLVSRRVLELTLTGWGHEVIAAADGEQAWAWLEQDPSASLAILDVMMPGLSGYQLCERIRAGPATQATYVILLTAKSQKADLLEGFGAGANDYLTKPFEPRELRARIEAAARVLGLQQDLALKVDQLRLSEERYRVMIETSLGLIYTHGSDGRLSFVNEAGARALGYNPEQMLGHNLREFLLASTVELLELSLARLHYTLSDTTLLHFLTGTGEERIYRSQSAVFGGAGQPPEVFGHAQDITDIKRAELALQDLALLDDLTGLHNRRGFLLYADKALRATRRMKESMTLFYSDMDGLKAINDRLGHATGSEAICRLAEVLGRAFRRPLDVSARLGGDEFVVLAVGEEPEAGGMGRIVENLAAANATGGFSYDLSLSVGFVVIRPDGPTNLDEVIAEADARMYASKRARKVARV